MRSGGDGLEALKAAVEVPHPRNGSVLRELVLTGLRERSHVSAAVESRVVDLAHPGLPASSATPAAAAAAPVAPVDAGLPDH
jgi:hypothetical protein